MDLGATRLHCARQPRCEACPLAADCVARAQGRPEAYPVKTRRLRRGRRSHALLWLQQGERLWLAQRPAARRLGRAVEPARSRDARALGGAGGRLAGHGPSGCRRSSMR